MQSVCDIINYPHIKKCEKCINQIHTKEEHKKERRKLYMREYKKTYENKKEVLYTRGQYMKTLIDV